LQWLLLDNNLLTGTLPTYFGAFPSLRQVQLQNNNLSGPVPEQWCSSSNLAVYDISRNPFLCGECGKGSVVSGCAGTSSRQLNSGSCL
jgi:hypothetical protein